MTPPHVLARAKRLIWIAVYVQRYGVITFERWQQAFGNLSLRTYRRDLAALVDAGLRLDGLNGVGSIGTMFYGFDETWPEFANGGRRQRRSPGSLRSYARLRARSIA